MKFLEAVKILYPQVNIRTHEIDKKLCYNEEDIIAFFGTDAIAKVPRYYDSYVNVVFGGDFSNKTTVFLTEKTIEYILKHRMCEKIKKIKELMSHIHAGCTDCINFTSGTSNIAVGYRLPTLTSSIFKTLLENSFPDEVFVSDLDFSTKSVKYESSLYMPKYNISFEFPDAKNSPEARTLFIEKANTKCIQLHDETAFGGDLAKTMLDYSIAIGVAAKIIATFNKK